MTVTTKFNKGDITMKILELFFPLFFIWSEEIDDKLYGVTYNATEL